MVLETGSPPISVPFKLDREAIRRMAKAKTVIERDSGEGTGPGTPVKVDAGRMEILKGFVADSPSSKGSGDESKQQSGSVLLAPAPPMSATNKNAFKFNIQQLTFGINNNRPKGRSAANTGTLESHVKK